MTELIHEKQKLVSLCPMCGLEGIQTQVEKLPKAGVLMQCSHSNGLLHRWAVYESIFEIGVKPRKEYKPITINCPVCGKHGNIYDQVPDKRKPENVKYLVHHGVVQGSRTPEHYNGKQIICHIKEQAHRDIILKKLGRYIEPQLPQRITLPEGKIEQKQHNIISKASLQHRVLKQKQVNVKSTTIECPRCHQNGVLNVAKKDQDPSKTTFLVRHEKIDGTWGRDHKVDRYNRHYIGRLNLKRLKFRSEYQAGETQEKPNLKGGGLDRYIEPEIKAHSTVKRKIHGKKSNPTIE